MLVLLDPKQEPNHSYPIKRILRLLQLLLRFLISAYDSNSDSVASENQP